MRATIGKLLGKRVIRPALAILCILLVGVWVVVYGPPWHGMGARSATPETALLEALGPSGWLADSSEITILQLLETPEGRVAVYADAEGNVGVADAEPSRGRWTAHGMFFLGPPHAVTCRRIPISGTTVTVAIGNKPQDAGSVVVVDRDGNGAIAKSTGSVWAAVAEGQIGFTRALVLSTEGDVLLDREIEDCDWP